ncbi:hypothetical protein SISSUDRAFT_1036509 [Sistotremastrum suecicum HHB10207 ss-3]|uniref:Uncharacterized protein n=1 Tax=Sistotremastrum suecicum HHB10207 ss-3 TaxID=1314776 RepID=A0A165ZCF4_9AGAM|nr:hypothetical protein SISSUDRAFT_1036509 [Sistotremastrum suecicum HHB10207 ss-3]
MAHAPGHHTGHATSQSARRRTLPTLPTFKGYEVTLQQLARVYKDKVRENPEYILTKDDLFMIVPATVAFLRRATKIGLQEHFMGQNMSYLISFRTFHGTPDNLQPQTSEISEARLLALRNLLQLPENTPQVMFTPTPADEAQVGFLKSGALVALLMAEGLLEGPSEAVANVSALAAQYPPHNLSDEDE